MANDEISMYDVDEGQVGASPADAEQKTADTEAQAEAEEGTAGAPAPVERFELPTGNVEGRMFQNGDTDPGDGRSD
jgi:hypothetical protein